MAYDTNWPLREEFEAAIQSLLDKHQMTYYDWVQMHYALDGLHYLATVKRDYPKVDGGPKNTQHVNCVVCGRSSVRPDACLLNFAAKDAPASWYCRDHYPKVDGLLPPGWHPAAAEQGKLDAMRMATWLKLTPEERALLNRNIVAVASSGE